MKPDITLLHDSLIPLTGAPTDFDALLERAKGKRVILLGEASHGTHEFYRIRAEITKRLIREQGFNAVAVEADWPDAHRINRFVQGTGSDSEAVEALSDFKRFPQWMWRNSDVLDFIGWLRHWNDEVNDHKRKGMAEAGAFPTGFYGLLAGSGMSENCKNEVLAALMELPNRKEKLLSLNGTRASDDYFDADQNARVVRDAEEYYRTMFRHDVSSWNLRDRHMMQTLLLLIQHLKQTRLRAKVVVWAHNSHLGNASATSMGARGEFNIGQLVREHFGNDALSIGFTTHQGTVTASSDWDGPAERKRVRPALPESYEKLFHETGVSSFWLDCHANEEVREMLSFPRLERAIGVIYRPDTERASHYFKSQLPEQFDGILHYDETRAVEPLERTVEWTAGEVEETYPSGL